MAMNSGKRTNSQKRQRANYKRKRRWSVENLEAKRLLAGDLVTGEITTPILGSGVSAQPVMMASADMTHDQLMVIEHSCDAHPGDPARARRSTALR